MKFAIITHTEHVPINQTYTAYAAYVREMNIWLKHVQEVKIVAPVVSKCQHKMMIPYQHESVKVDSIPVISLIGVSEILKAVLYFPLIFFKVYKAMKWADHIHLRCPGNIGLIGCIAQIFFPDKIKTVKYAGNWDPDAKQPKSYRLQKWILSNNFLSRNVTVLAYGEWNQGNKNIKSFFTATFTEEEAKEKIEKSFSSPFKCMFVGALVKGKRPMFAVQLVEKLRAQDIAITLDLYGDGILRKEIENYIQQKNLNDVVFLKGNQPLDVLKETYRKAHFLILASKSEGWPKAIAEAMFWGTIPIATNVSCVPWMLGNGSRGILIEPDLNSASMKIKEFLAKQEQLEEMSSDAQVWSRQYTTNKFEAEVKKLLHK